ncbi:MAG TPA: hypothetical protein VFR41_03240, partial [Acidimicrobiia bacterium]|nr:hypothetical protein [Acidimicrobiia bacterium]
QHFADMEALYAACVERQHAHLADLAAPLDRDGALDVRIERVVDRWASIYERIAPVRRAAVRVAPDSPVVRRELERVRILQRRELAALFSSELNGRARRDRLAALEAALTFGAWDHLRATQNLSAAATRRVMTFTIRAVLGEEP